MVVGLCRVKGVLKDFVLWDSPHCHSSSVTSPHSKEVLVCTLVEDEGRKVGFTSDRLFYIIGIVPFVLFDINKDSHFSA